MLGITSRKIPYFFSFDMLNYARTSLVYLSQMMQMKGYDPTYDFFESGKFSVNISCVSFTVIGADLGIESENSSLKALCGIKELTNKQPSLDENVTAS